MNDRSDIERVLGYWLEDGPVAMPDRVIDVVARRISVRPQRRSWRLIRRSPMSPILKWATAPALVAVVVVAVIGFNVVGNPAETGIGVPTTPTSTASPTATPSPSAPVASPIDPVVLLRVEIRGDVSFGRIPSLTVYGDGTVLRPDDSRGRISRLTPQGMSLLLAPAMDSDLLVTSGSIGPDPAYQGGFTSYAIDLRRGEQMVRRGTTNSLTPTNRAEGERIIALAEHLVDLESWLPAEAWATRPSSASPYIASDFLLKVTVTKKQPGSVYQPKPLDVADVDWPLAGHLEDFGEAVTPPPLGAGSTSRCGLVTLEEAVAVERALAAAPPGQATDKIEADLDWANANSFVSVSLAPLLPDDLRDCTVDGSFP